MKRHILTRCLGITICLASLCFFLLRGASLAEKPALKKEDQEKLCVTIWTVRTRIEINESVDVTLRVVNSTDIPLSVKVWSAGWDAHWKISNARILLAGIPGHATGNVVESIRLEPGEAYENHAQITVRDGPPLVTTSFQMGFTPYGAKTTYWSNKVVLGIKPGGRK